MIQDQWSSGFCFVFFIIPCVAIVEMKQADVLPCKKSDFDFIPATDEVVGRFRSALRMQTVAREAHDYNRKELKQLGDFIKDGTGIQTNNFLRDQLGP